METGCCSPRRDSECEALATGRKAPTIASQIPFALAHEFDKSVLDVGRAGRAVALLL